MTDKKILIVDESGFSRICSALLEAMGYPVESISGSRDLLSALNNSEFGLIVTSYPFGGFLFDEISKRRIPAIILSDNIDDNVLGIMNSLPNSFGFVKPINYGRFRELVGEIMSGRPALREGYSIVYD